MKLTDNEWAVLEVLWQNGASALGEITESLESVCGWNKNTVYTYLTRMAKKGIVKIDRSRSAPYSSAVSREDCAREERRDLLSKVYGGAAGDMIAAFLKETQISSAERDRLRKLLDDMEV